MNNHRLAAESAVSATPPDQRSVPVANASVLLAESLLLDLETTIEGRLLKIGAISGEQVFERSDISKPGRALAELDQFARGARYLIGHNLFDHDLPTLRSLGPQLGLLQLPVIDTLYLSPLAYPENPYHRLVKDYKLVRDAVNDPVADARLAARVFQEQWVVLAARAASQPVWLDLLHFAFDGSVLGRDNIPAHGMLAVWRALGARSLAHPWKAIDSWIAAQACRAQQRQAIAPLLESPRLRPILAYVLTWLLVAGGNSILPPWVRRRFPEIGAVLHQLREQSCNDSECGYCPHAHDPQAQLKRWFGFERFRPTPTADDGGSLQRAIVQEGMVGQPLLGILPTGGGKSLCFQVPALARYQRRSALTVVVSPLQALMKDQVEGLNRRVGSEISGALNGLLTPPERGELMERVRLGDVALLYVSPEQFRNRSFREVLASREIGAWVFDEAHCLSKWGHDFRPDYLYCARFIREFTRAEGVCAAPVFAYTATAKLEVIREICRHFEAELGLTLTVFAGGVERDNLRFEVQPVTRAEKYGRIDALLRERLQAQGGAAIVYCATRNATEQTAEFLRTQGWSVAAFHAGLNPLEKRAIQDAFIRDETRVICATNAFGMGIDKENVRLVLHSDAPGSLENYLQEAGRAGRDREPAECVLLYAREDVERQFRMEALTELSRRDIAGILRGLRWLQQRRGPDEPVVVTSGELLREKALDLSFDADDRHVDTRIKTAVAWLERAGFVARNENHTRVFQGKPMVASMEEAEARLARLNLSATTRGRYRAVLQALLESDPDDGLSSDELAQLPALKVPPGAPPIKVLRVLDAMQAANLLGVGMQLTAFLRPRGSGGAMSALTRFAEVCRVEQALIGLLRESAPGADQDRDQWHELALRQINQRLLDDGQPSDPELLRKLLKSLCQDGRGLAGERSSLLLRHAGKDRIYVKLQRDWGALSETAERRRAVAGVLLRDLLARVPDGARGEVLVEFSLDDLRAALSADTLLSAQVKQVLPAIERALLFLHEQQAIALQKGLAVFRQAMTIQVLAEAKGRAYGGGDYAPLALHYRERIFQVHVMDEYARLALVRITQALELVSAYFSLDRRSLLKRFFAGREDALRQRTSPESFRAIVESLGNPVQQAIVAAPEAHNLLVLAGPGSGKTRVVVHRVAYLLRVKRVPSRSILVLCYNRSAVLQLRRRLFELMGREARGVTVQTFHGLALRLSGHAMDGRRGGDIEFGELIREATALLKGERDLIGVEAEELRDRLLEGYRHVLVDEYQDIDEAQYQLVSAIAGRTLEDPDRRLAILAVGDDDQNIYAFRGASVEFIRRFQSDYQAHIHSLVENYRSTGHVIDAANRLIERNRERMKTQTPIRVDRQRRQLPPGGPWHDLDPVARGHVQVLPVAGVCAQARATVAEIQRLVGLQGSPHWNSFAVLGRTRAELLPVRAALEYLGVPVRLAIERERLPSPFQVREIADLLDRLRGLGFNTVDPCSLHGSLPVDLPWTSGLGKVLEDLAAEAGGAVAAPLVLEALAEWLVECRQEAAAGDGVWLGTAHGAKGLEFDHVFVLGDWQHVDAAEVEAERRLFYVAMTRARCNLILLQRADRPHPHLSGLEGDFRQDRERGPLAEVPAHVLGRRFEILKLDSLFVSFGGRQRADHPIHAALAEARPGDALSLTAAGTDVWIVDHEGRRLAKLSKSAAERWTPERLQAIESARLLFLLRRDREREAADYRERLQVAHWYVPVVELTLSGVGSPSGGARLGS